MSYRVRFSDADRSSPGVVFLPKPPVLERPQPEGFLNLNYKVDAASRATEKYDVLFRGAWEKYMGGAQANVPERARWHDGGLAWLRHHEMAFKAANPPLGSEVPYQSLAPYQTRWHGDRQFPSSTLPRRPTTVMSAIRRSKDLQQYTYGS